MLYRFLNACINRPSNRNWVSSVLKDMEDLKDFLEIEGIKKMPKLKFKEYV